jgi:hypothetical protein
MSSNGRQRGQSSVGKTEDSSQELVLTNAAAHEKMDQDTKQSSSVQVSSTPWKDMTLEEKIRDLVRNGHASVNECSNCNCII